MVATPGNRVHARRKDGDSGVTHVTINGDKCQGHGRCALIAPHLFDVDDDGLGLVQVDTVAGADLPDVEEAILSCPESAITLAG
ncbi:MAG: ferredoxin [Pseudonocardiales bacterium]|nr:ferredoxin [Pseudonocardiales bacterium]MDT7620090.1 ferredoxin [Pseudonocardiales bacterium]MDT7658216.1 ferredoxin [Pseudonocardiales bacterium]MDT7695119.1 ferredoxin [Pseudonocardiales bacterium]